MKIVNSNVKHVKMEIHVLLVKETESVTSVPVPALKTLMKLSKKIAHHAIKNALLVFHKLKTASLVQKTEQFHQTVAALLVLLKLEKLNVQPAMMFVQM